MHPSGKRSKKEALSCIVALVGSLFFFSGVSKADPIDLLVPVQQIPWESLYQVLEHADLIFFQREDPIPQVSLAAALNDAPPEEVWGW